MLLHGASVPRRLRAVRWVLAGRAFASAESPTAAPSKSALLTELQLLPPFAGSPAASVTRERLRALLPARHPLAVRQSLAAWPVLAAAVLEYLVVVAQPARRRSRKAQPPATAAAKNDPRPPSAAVSAPKPKPAAAADAVRAPRQPRAPPGVVAAPPPPAPPPAAAVAGSAPPAAATAQPPPPPAAVATASSPAAQPAAPPPTPRPYQETGIEFILAQKAALLADDMGLGKTAQALVALSRLPDAGAAVVVCPAFLKLNWEREARRWLPGRSVHIVQKADLPWPDAPNLVVVNYEILHRLLPALEQLQPTAVVFDESQYVKNEETRRSAAALQLAVAARRCGARVVLLSGTPVLNRPFELVHQLEVLGVQLGKLTSAQFKTRYCDPQTGWAGGRTYTSYRGASHVAELHARLTASPWFLRRVKADVLTELPEKVHARVVVQLPAASAAAYQAHLRQAAARRSLAEARGALADGAALGDVARLRSLLAELKRPLVCAWIDNWLECTPPDRKLIVFAHHVSLVDAVAARFGGLRIRGCDPPAARQRAVDAFQAPAPGAGAGGGGGGGGPPSPRVIACNIAAAGVGLTLTAASDVLFAELAWSPAQNTQAEDRAHRMGQRRTVCVHTLIAAGTFDAAVVRALDRKRRVVQGAVDGGRGGGWEAGDGGGDGDGGGGGDDDDGDEKEEGEEDVSVQRAVQRALFAPGGDGEGEGGEEEEEEGGEGG